MRARWLAAPAAALGMACAPQVDVVAVQDEAGPMAEAGADGAPDVAADDGQDADVAPPPMCDPMAASSIYLAEQIVLARFSPATGMLTSLGAPDCAKAMMLSSFVAMAASPDGMVWLADVTGLVVVVDPMASPPACKGMPFKVMAGGGVGLAFLPPPPPAAPPLYVAANGNLLVMDSRSYVQAPVGPFAEMGLLGLTGTFDGRLYAVGAGMSAAAPSLWLLDPGDGHVTSTTTVMLPNMQPLAGGAYWGGAIYFFGDAVAFTYDLANGKVDGPTMLPTMGLTAVASAPCPPGP